MPVLITPTLHVLALFWAIGHTSKNVIERPVLNSCFTYDPEFRWILNKDFILCIFTRYYTEKVLYW